LIALGDDADFTAHQCTAEEEDKSARRRHERYEEDAA
jgi:hypothetical protein